MTVLEGLMFDLEDRLKRRNISTEKRNEALNNFGSWVNRELIELPDTKYGPGLSDFFSVENRIKRWQDHYSSRPEDCPPKEWPIFKKEEWVDKREFGRTPLHRAVMAGDLEKVKSLVSDGANTKMKDNGGNTPFELAVLEDMDDIVLWFQDEGINE